MSLWSHYWDVLRASIKDDRARRKDIVRSSETTFLPAALEIIESPVSPTARATTWVLLVGLVVTTAWLIFGRVDVVASAQGKIIPTGNVKIVQSAGSGVVRAIYVRDGDVVKAGQPLLDLDSTLSSADLAQAEKALAAAELDIARNRAIADALGGRGFHFTPPPGLSPEVADTQRRLIAAQLAEFEATSAGLSAARSSSLSDAHAAEAQMAKLGETVPILDREIENMNRLDRLGYAPGLRLLELQRQRRQEAGDRDIAAAQQARGYSEGRKLGQQINQAREQARRTALTDLAKAQAEAILRREEVTKAAQKRKFQRLVASEDGTIQQLAVHTIGGVVEPARTLMTIVPSWGGLEVEVRLLNKDVGFIHVGQVAAVKLEAFPFTRYGAVPGRVKSISRDAVPDQRLGSVYIATVILDRTTIAVDQRDVPLSAGLAATVDIRTGSRRIIGYLLSPIQTSVAQAGRER
jgi:hemolysin D